MLRQTAWLAKQPVHRRMGQWEAGKLTTAADHHLSFCALGNQRTATSMAVTMVTTRTLGYATGSQGWVAYSILPDS